MSAPLPTDIRKLDADAWQPWVPDARQPFDAKWAGHLYRRAAFGASPDAVRVAVRDGLEATIARLLAGEPRATARRELLDYTGDQLARADEIDKLRGWWLYAMLQGGHPLREKMVLFWHNHFATSNAKVQSAALMFRQNRLLREHALGHFRPLLNEMARDPAMLVWLDSNENVKAHPNENFAREVMELFSLGVGNYTETDIREVARSFTGWHTDGEGTAFEFNAAQHDDGPKKVLGRAGNFNGDDVLELLLAQPACARFLAAKLYRFFVSESEPPAAVIDSLAERIRRDDFNIGSAVPTILRSRLFFSAHAYRQRIKSPVEFVLGAVSAAWPGPFPPTALVQPIDDMGQALFSPPNVKGWTGGKNWLNDATLLTRHNFAERVAMGILPPFAIKDEDGIPKPKTPESTEPSETDELLFIVPRTISSATVGLLISGTGSVALGITPPNHPNSITGGTGGIIKNRREPKKGMEDRRPEFDATWYAVKMKANTPEDVVRLLAEQFLAGDMPDKVRVKLEAFLTKAPQVTKNRVREAIHAVMCMPEYQVC